ncbi:MAG: ankyrin repeat domain-containing protein [Verrucomicrobiota bacterium]
MSIDRRNRSDEDRGVKVTRSNASLPPWWQWKSRVLCWVSLLWLAGCSEQDPEEMALKRLDDAALSFTVANFHRCAKENRFEALKNYLDAGMHPDARDSKGVTPILHASQQGYEKIVQLLLDRGANPDQMNGSGRSLMLQAVDRGAVRTFNRLRLAGADPVPADSEGWTVPALAAKNGLPEILQQVLPVDPAMIDRCLFLAAENGHTRCLDLLLQAGAFIDVRGKQDRTPLLVAAEAGRKEAVRLLLESGADRLALDHEAKSARDLAREAGDREMVAILGYSPTLPDPGPGEDLFMEKDSQDIAPPPIDGRTLETRPDPGPERTFLLGDHLRFVGIERGLLPFFFSGYSKLGQYPVIHVIGWNRGRYGTPVKPGDRLPGSTMVYEASRKASWNSREVNCLVLRDRANGRYFLLPEKDQVMSGAYEGLLGGLPGQVFRVRPGDEFSVEPIGREYLVLTVTPGRVELMCHSTNSRISLALNP